MIFIKPYVDDILLIRNDINFLTRIRTSLEIVFSWRTWANIALVLSTVIYEDSKCLIMLKPTESAIAPDCGFGIDYNTICDE